MNLKISHKESYIIYDFDIQNEKASIIENNANDFLKIIFADKNYNEIKRWLISRCGGKKTIEEAINLCKTNKGVSVVDNITIEIM
ncbi:MAG: hypothetical protein Q4E51_10460 [Lachnospiraceae bacterium]|nr:hypothetical protein [Lachnospiraceae bacterium]